MHLTEKDHGRILARGPVGNASIFRVLSVYRTGYNPAITTEAWDGVASRHEPTMWRTFDQNSEDWRPATDEETAQFLRLYTPPPQNWE